MTRNPLDIVRTFQVELPVDVEGAILALGIELDRSAALPPGISGELRKLPTGRFVIKASAREHLFRRRFTMAHELGHFIFHRDIVGDGVDDDQLYRSTTEGDIYNSRIKRIHEAQANSFAANFLMPKDLMRKELRKVGPVVDALYPRFQVSPSAMRWRLSTMDVEEQV